ncbi:MAG: hypothetical protein RLY93_13970 [Sumerlaeia bacterium]
MLGLRLFLFGLCGCLMAVPRPLAAASPGSTYEGLIVVLPPADSTAPVARRFASDHLPGIETTAAELGMDLRQIDPAAAGVPAEVHLAPVVLYQNARGRSIFQGRYADPGKIAHFARTVRFVPQGAGEIVRPDAAVRQHGRAKVAALLKITPLTGALPAGHDEEDFQEAARAAFFAGLEGFARQSGARLSRSDRTFYFDVHPYVDGEGRLFLGAEIYSQFNCHVPVYSALSQPHAGSWAAWREELGALAGKLVVELDRIIAESELGDGFVALPGGLAAPGWEALGLALPENSADSMASFPAGGAVKARKWTSAGDSANGVPPIQFRFPPPLDNYAGVLPEVKAELRLTRDRGLGGASGWVEAEAKRVTLGEPGLDDTVHSEALMVGDYPKARFDLDRLEPETDEPLKLGEAARAVGSGQLTMAGQSALLSGIRAEILPVLTQAGEERLEVTASFQVRLLEPYGIYGPDGPDPANDTLEFLVTLTMEPQG